METDAVDQPSLISDLHSADSTNGIAPSTAVSPAIKVKPAVAAKPTVATKPFVKNMGENLERLLRYCFED